MSKFAPQQHRIESDLLAQVQSLFGRFPGLYGFSVQDRDGLPDDIDPSGREGELFVMEMGLSSIVSDDEYLETYKMVSSAIAQLVADEPEAFDVLRGRTFARTLH